MSEIETIKLKTKDGKIIEIAKKVAELSEFLKSSISNLEKDSPIELTEVDEVNCEKIKEYLTHFNGVAPKEIEKPLTSNEMKNVTDEWSANFIEKMTVDEVVNLTAAANYMEISCLLDLCCAKLASLCKDKSEKDIFKAFNVTEPISDEEKKKIFEENRWIDENI